MKKVILLCSVFALSFVATSFADKKLVALAKAPSASSPFIKVSVDGQEIQPRKVAGVPTAPRLRATEIKEIQARDRARYRYHLTQGPDNTISLEKGNTRCFLHVIPNIQSRLNSEELCLRRLGLERVPTATSDPNTIQLRRI